ncbi:MAG: hypothetical protein WCG23_07250 [bacterium]
MAKAINWPKEFYDEVISEDMESVRIAIRPGSLYFDNCYYTPDEVVDIRVDHKIVRQGIIVGDLELVKIKDISDENLAKYKKSMSNKKDLIDFLSKNYNQQINDDDEVTLITYKNLEIAAPDDDDPHM